MFDVEQFHQFMSTSSTAVSPTRATTIIIHPPPNTSYSPLISSTHTSTNHNNPFHLSSSSFDLHHHHPLLFPPNYQLGNQLFQSNDHSFVVARDDDDQYMNDDTADDECKEHMDLAAAAAAGAGIHHMNNDSWSNDEVVQLLRIKSTASTDASSHSYCFKPHNWDHVSRKLAEMGYKRSAESCKEKFEEETCRSFGSSSSMGYKSSSNRYLISEELDENLYHHPDHQNMTHHLQSPDQNDNHQEEAKLHQKKEGEESNLEPRQQQPEEQIIGHSGDAESRKGNYNKRKRKFKMVKGLCIEFVNKMMAQQEEMHKKLLQDMEKHEKEKITREEAWRKEEMERVKRDIDMREHEQELARDRQCTITECLNKITCLDQKIQVTLLQGLQTADIPLPPPDHENQMTKDRKRWPRDEVLALINIRSCNVNHGGDEYDDINIGNNNNNNKGAAGGGGGGGGGSVWERISQGMLELGYKRSAKRCKEKWENINKYFRKTKDANKKRPLDSRTCPYYHELTKLYNQQKQQQLQLAAAASSNTQNCNNTATTSQNS